MHRENPTFETVQDVSMQSRNGGDLVSLSLQTGVNKSSCAVRSANPRYAHLETRRVALEARVRSDAQRFAQDIAALSTSTGCSKPPTAVLPADLPAFQAWPLRGCGRRRLAPAEIAQRRRVREKETAVEAQRIRFA